MRDVSYLKWFERRTLVALCAGSLLIGAMGCHDDVDGDDLTGTSETQEAGASSMSSLEAEPTRNTFIGGTTYLEIDQFFAGHPQDANLVALGHPGEPISRLYPCPKEDPPGAPLADEDNCESAGFDWIDWNDLNTAEQLANHRIMDVYNGRDQNAFPRKASCIGESNVLSKMDLTYFGVANNYDYAYFVLQRANNNGDAAYTILFNKTQPSLDTQAPECKTEEAYLTYTLEAGDIMIRGHFKPSANEPLVTIYKVKPGVHETGLTAAQATDFTNTALYEVDTNGAVAASAVNTTPTLAGSWGSEGVGAVSNGILEEEIIIEAAIDMNFFLDTENGTCDGVLWGSVITRPSGAGGTSPDFKDFIGAIPFNFLPLSASPTLATDCGEAFTFDAFGGNGGEGECSWDFDCGDATIDSVVYDVGSNDCTGTVNLSNVPPGGVECDGTVTVSDEGGRLPAACGATEDSNKVMVHPVLEPEVELDTSCESDLSFAAVDEHDNPFENATCVWTFDCSNAEPDFGADESKCSGILVIDPAPADGVPTSCKASVTVKQSTNGLCEYDGDNTKDVLHPISVSIVAGDDKECSFDNGLMITDEIMYTATINGGTGTGNHSIVWGPDHACDDQLTCTIDPPDNHTCVRQTIQASVTDGICGTAHSNAFDYKKVTTITSTPTPADP